MTPKRKDQIRKTLELAMELLEDGMERRLRLTVQLAAELSAEEAPELTPPTLRPTQAARPGAKTPAPKPLPAPLLPAPNALTLATADEVFDEVLTITRDAAELVGKDHNFLADYVRQKCGLEHVACDEALIARAIAQVRGE